MQSLVRPRILFFGGSITEGADADAPFTLYPESARWTSLIAARCKPIVNAEPQRSMLAGGSPARCIGELTRALNEHQTGLRAVVLELGPADLGSFESADDMIGAVNALARIADDRGIPVFFLAHCGADFEHLGRLADRAKLEQAFLDAAQAAQCENQIEAERLQMLSQSEKFEK